MDTRPLCDSMEDGMEESEGDEDGGAGRSHVSTADPEEMTPFVRLSDGLGGSGERENNHPNPHIDTFTVPQNQNYRHNNKSMLESIGGLSSPPSSQPLYQQQQQQQQSHLNPKISYPSAIPPSQLHRRDYPYSHINDAGSMSNSNSNTNSSGLLRKPLNSTVIVGLNEDEHYSSSSPFHSATASPLYTGDSADDFGPDNEHDRDPLIKPPEKTGAFHKLLSSKLKGKQASSSSSSSSGDKKQTQQQQSKSCGDGSNGIMVEEEGRRKCSVGIFLAAVSCIFFATSALIVKISNLHPMELLGVRGFIQCILVSPLVISSKSSLIPDGSKSLLLARAVLGSVALIMSFASITLIPLADAATVIFTSPVFVSIFACLCLGEICSWFDVVMITLTLLGVLLVSKPSFDFINTGSWVNIAGISSGLTAALLTALAFIVLRQLKHVHYSVTVFWFSTILASFGVVLTIALDGFTLPNDVRTISECIGIGVCGFFGQILLTKALQLEAAAPVAVARTLDIVIAFFFQLTLLHDIPDWKSYVGSALVVACVILTAFRRWYRETEDISEEEENKLPVPSSSHLNPNRS